MIMTFFYIVLVERYHLVGGARECDSRRAGARGARRRAPTRTGAARRTRRVHRARETRANPHASARCRTHFAASGTAAPRRRGRSCPDMRSAARPPHTPARPARDSSAPVSDEAHSIVCIVLVQVVSLKYETQYGGTFTVN